MDWFERVTGFAEGTYEDTRKRLSVVDGRLHGSGANRGHPVGTLTLPSLTELRAKTAAIGGSGRPRLSIAEGDVREMHRASVNRGALVQVASQFNMLEMVGPEVTPESGVTRYAADRTQGPACAMAAGAATIYRNYLVPVADGTGQTSTRQLDGLADLGAALAQRLGTTVAALWTMRNGYALATADGLASIARLLRDADAETLDGLRGLLRIGLHQDVGVTDKSASQVLVSQVFCSALPVAYSRLPGSLWSPFACLVLEAAYEATLLAGLLNARRGVSKRVLLTRLGGGAFGNDEHWIDAAMLRALRMVADHDVEIVIVSYGAAPESLRDLVQRSGFA